MKVLTILHSDALQGVTTFNYTFLEAIKEKVEGTHDLEYHIIELQQNGFVSEFLKLGATARVSGNDYDLVIINNRPGLDYVVKNEIKADRYLYFTHSIPNEEDLQAVVLPPSAPSLPYILDEKLEIVVFSEVAKNYLEGLGHEPILIRNAINLDRFKSHEPPTKIEKILLFDLRNNLEYRAKFQNLANVFPNTYLRSIVASKWEIAEEIASADLVVAYGRCAIEAMAMGKPVIIYGQNGGDGLVTNANKEKLAETNFSGWSIRNMPVPEYLSEMDIMANIMVYNAAEMAQVQAHIRANYGTLQMLQTIGIVPPSLQTQNGESLLTQDGEEVLT